MMVEKYLQNTLIGTVALVVAAAHFVPGADKPGPVSAAVVAAVRAPLLATTTSTAKNAESADPTVEKAKAALGALSALVRPLSHPQALEDAFRSYFAFKNAHPNEVRKPFLYFVDYGLSSTTPRGYVFNMNDFSIVDGPFAVAHGRGSSTSQYGVPSRFSNSSGAATSSLGLYVAGTTYDFTGHSGGRAYSAVGMRLLGMSGNFNSNAFNRGVVAHGAPYVTDTRAGRSEGCPAMEPSRAKRLLPMLANGGVVFLFAPDQNWLAGDPWLNASAG